MTNGVMPVLATIHQPEFFPWAGFFNKIVTADTFCVFDNVQFKKNYFENRCRVMLNGKASWLTAPILHKGRSDQVLSEVQIDNRTPWGTKVWKSLFFNYAKAPFWHDHAEFLEDCFAVRRWDRLVDLNMHALHYYCGYLGLNFAPVMGSQVCGKDVQGAELVLDTCKRLGATAYLSGRFGKDYLDEEAFRAAGIDLIYQEFQAPAYSRPDGTLSEPLSVLDMTMVLGRAALRFIEGKV